MAKRKSFFDGLMLSDEIFVKEIVGSDESYLPYNLGSTVHMVIAEEEITRLNDFLYTIHQNLQKSSKNYLKENLWQIEADKGHDIDIAKDDILLGLDHSFLGNYEILAIELSLHSLFSRLEFIFKYFQYYGLISTDKSLKFDFATKMDTEVFLTNGFLGFALCSLRSDRILEDIDLMLPNLIRARKLRNQFAHGDVDRKIDDYKELVLVDVFLEIKKIFVKISDKNLT